MYISPNNNWFLYSAFLVWYTTQSALQCIITPVTGFNINPALIVHILYSLGSILARCHFRGAHMPHHATNNVRILPGTHLYTWVESSNVDKVSCWRTKSARHWRESNPEPFDPEWRVHSNIPRFSLCFTLFLLFLIISSLSSSLLIFLLLLLLLLLFLLLLLLPHLFLHYHLLLPHLFLHHLLFVFLFFFLLLLFFFFRHVCFIYLLIVLHNVLLFSILIHMYATHHQRYDLTGVQWQKRTSVQYSMSSQRYHCSPGSSHTYRRRSCNWN